MDRNEAMALAEATDRDGWAALIEAQRSEHQAERDEECARSAHGHADIVLESGERPTCRNCGREPSPEQLASWCGKAL